MPTYIRLLKWTDRGRRDVKTMYERIDDFSRSTIEVAGAKVIAHYTTLGQYDAVAIWEAPNDDVIMRLGLEIAARGNGITETMRAFTREEMQQLMQADRDTGR